MTLDSPSQCCGPFRVGGVVVQARRITEDCRAYFKAVSDFSRFPRAPSHGLSLIIKSTLSHANHKIIELDYNNNNILLSSS